MRKAIPSLLILFVGGIAIALGLMRGEARVMFQKAVNICLECIGLG